jgi:hypothetical protein
VVDVDRTLVLRHGRMVCDRLDRLAPATLDAIRSTPGVGLYHIADEWYRDPLVAVLERRSGRGVAEDVRPGPQSVAGARRTMARARRRGPPR